MKNIKVFECRNCPFSTFSLAGGHYNLIWTGRKRLQHSCNLQKLPTQYKANSEYDCFNTCPLRDMSFTVELAKQ